MATLAGLIERARLEIGDTARSFQSVVTADGVTRRFDLAYAPVEPLGLRIFYQSELQELDPAEYTLDDSAGILTLNVPGAPGDTLVVQGYAYRYFTTEEWRVFTRTAFTQHTNGTGHTLGSLPGVEEYLVSLLAVIEALWALATDASKDIDISTPEGVSVPRSQRFRQLMEMIQARTEQYRELAAALNVGIGRIEMFNLRRVSRTTGRYIPVFLDRELEDTTSPRRVYPVIDNAGGPPPVDTLEDTPIHIVQGEPFELDLAVGQDLTGHTVRVSLRRYKRSAAYRHFRIEVIDAPAGRVVARLTSNDTWALGGGPYWWDLSVINPDRQRRTLHEGSVTTEARART